MYWLPLQWISVIPDTQMLARKGLSLQFQGILCSLLASPGHYKNMHAGKTSIYRISFKKKKREKKNLKSAGKFVLDEQLN